MKRDRVISSNIASIGYDASAQLLEVEFTSGDVYQYKDVPENVVSELLTAQSIGQFLNRRIKNAYTFRRV
jgi:hypothetical protein